MVPVAARSATVWRSSRAATGSTPIDGSSRNSTSRPVQQPAGDVQPLPHAPGVALDPVVLPAGQPDQLEQLGDPRASAPGAGTPYSSAK